MKKRVMASFLAASLALTGMPAWAAEEFSDMPQNWSTAALKQAVENGLLKGIDGKICADDYLTRAQMAAITVRSFGTQTQEDLSQYGDVSETDWYYQAMSAAVSMGVLSGYDNKLHPNDNITRQEVCSMLARAFRLEEGNTTVLQQYDDAADVDSWAKGSVAAMVQAGYLHGSNGKLFPDAPITRAEFAAVMANMVSQYIDTAEVITKLKAGNVVINAAGVTLKDVAVQGDLILADGIDRGSVTLDNVTVTGRIIVRGGQELLLQGETSADLLNIANQTGKTNVQITEPAEITEVYVSTDADISGDGAIETVSVTDGTVNVNTEKTVVKNNGGIVTAAGKTVPYGATAVLNETGTDAKIIQNGDATGNSDNYSGSGNSGSSGGSGGSSGSGDSDDSDGSGGDSDEDEQVDGQFVQLDETKIVDLGWVQYLVVSFQTGTAADYTLLVDSVEITAEPVEDSGLIVKWEIEHLNHQVLTVVRNDDGVKQEISLTKGATK